MTKPNDYPRTVIAYLREALVMAGSYQDTQNLDYLRSLLNLLESATMQTRNAYEQSADGLDSGKYGGKVLKPISVAGRVELIESAWLHIRLNTLLPHCRFQTPAFLTDTITRLLNEFQSAHGELPFYNRALLVIDEHCDVGHRTLDQDNKGWKAVPNALKGRVFPDDDQKCLDLALLSKEASEPACHIYVLAKEDASDFFALRSEGRL
ncbi:hypothetical protein LJC32_03695 [Oscillospiraceae bacterium OttesenSCG-928-F05]|nr:hypothetical protein [Oscillospiraceae bacterium OttesenSCG-928-F05]